MEKSDHTNSGNFYKCPYQTQVYGTDKCELIYRKSYQGDWGDWDDVPETNIQDENEDDQVENEDESVSGSIYW